MLQLVEPKLNRATPLQYHPNVIAYSLQLVVFCFLWLCSNVFCVDVYESCLPENGNDYVDPQNFHISNLNPTVKLVKPVQGHQQSKSPGKHVHIADSPSIASDTKPATSPEKKVARPAVFNRQASAALLGGRPNKAFLDRSKQLGMGE